MNKLISLYLSPQLEIRFWRFNEYLDARTQGPPAIIPVLLVQSQAARVPIRKYPVHASKVVYDEDHGSYLRRRGAPDRIWATIGLTRVCLHLRLLLKYNLT